MGIRDSIKRRLPILGMGGNRPSATGAGSAAPTAPRSPPAWQPDPEPDSPRGAQPVEAFIDQLVKSNPVVVFMKGSPQMPQCGFSANAAAILQSYGKPLVHFDVLSDPDVRQGVKDYSSWPTIPQVYVGGEFLGGSDILKQMHDSGELRAAIDAAFAPAG
jgi:monothiol glutaredoxin